MMKLFDVLDWRAIAVASLLGFLAGGVIGTNAMHKLDQAAYTALELKVAKAEATAKDAATKKEAADRKAGEAIAARTVAEGRLSQYEFNQIRKGNNYVETSIRAQGIPAHELPAGWVRQYNASLSAGAGQAPAPTGGTAAAPARAGAAESPEALAAASGIDEWDVLDNSTDNAEGYAACRRQLNRLIDWALATTD